MLDEFDDEYERRVAANLPIVDYAAAGITPDEEVAPQVAWPPLPKASAERLGVSPAVLAESGMKKPIGTPMSLNYESLPEGLIEGA